MYSFTGMERRGRNSRENTLPEGFAAWCRIEDLSRDCGYDPAGQFGCLLEIAQAYPGRAGQDPEDYAEEHPLQALAALVRRFLAEYPEAAAAMAAGGKTRRRPGKAA